MIGQKKLRLLTTLALLSFAFPVYALTSWILAANKSNDIQVSKELFLNAFPEVIQHSGTISLLSIMCCVIAVILGYISRKVSGIFWNKLNLLVIVLSLILFMLNLCWLI
jgi:ABC-type uncharacterized transport system YnjBCD permease subunit